MPAEARARRFAPRPGLTLPALALVLMLGIIIAVEPRVASYFGLTVLLGFAIPSIFAALAQMAIIATGDIDLGIGTFISLVNCIAATWLTNDPALGIAALAGLVLVYAGMGALIHLRSLPAIVVTLGASFVWLGLAILVLPTPGGAAPGWLTTAATWHPPLLPLPIFVGLVAGAAGEFLLMRSAYGVVLRGVGGNPRAIARGGWSLLRARVALYAAAGFSGVIGGLALTGLDTSGDATVGAQYTLVSIAAVIVGGGEFAGGVVSPTGAVVGAFIMLLTGSLLSFLNISTDWQLSVQGAILILVLAARALGRREPA